MENNSIDINRNYNDYENFVKQYHPSYPFDEYCQNFENNSQLNEQNRFDLYKNFNLLNNKNENMKFRNQNEEEINADMPNNKSDFILNQNSNILNKKFYKKNNYLLDEEKKRFREEERQKKLKYHLMLDEQVREKKLREEKEREKRLKEDLFYEEKYKYEQEKLKEIENQKEKETIFNNINNENYYNLRQNYLQNVYNEDNIEQRDEQLEKEYINDYNNEYNNNLMMNLSQNNNNENYEAYNNYNNNMHSQLSINNNQFPPTIENLVSNSSQMPFNINKNNSQGFKTQNYYYPNNKILPQQSPNYFISQNINPYLTQNQSFNYQQKLNQPLSDIPTNLSVSPSVILINCQIPTNINRMMSSNPNVVNSTQSNQFGNNIPYRNINEFSNNINNINNQHYVEKMMEKFFNEQNKIIESYKETIRQLKNERDEALIKNKANEEKLLALQNLQKIKNKNREKSNYIPFKDENNQNIDNYLSTIHKDELNTNNQKGEISLLSDSKLPPLITSTKLVKPNSKKDILETWKKEEKENGKKLEFNGMDTNYIMDKITQINNTILEKSITNNNGNKNDCMIDISLISKTNEDKSNTKSNNNNTNEYKSNTKSNNNNNELLLQNESEFKIEINEEINNNNSKEKEDKELYKDSVEIISNKNNNLILINKEDQKEEQKEEQKESNNINNNDNELDNNNINIEKDRNEGNIISKKHILKLKENGFDKNLFNIDNNISCSTQIKKREEYKKSNINFSSYILKNESKKYNTNLQSNKEININNSYKNNDNDKNIYKNDNYNIGVNNEINDFPNTDSPKEAFHTIQTFNPNKNKNCPSIKKSNNIIKNKEEKDKDKDFINQINFFDDNSILSNNKSKNKKNKNISIKPNESINNNQFYKEDKNKNENKIKDSINSIKDSLILNESLNTFTQNLNKKWKNMTKNDLLDYKKEDLSDIDEVKKDDLQINNFDQSNHYENNEFRQNKFDKENTIDKFDEIRKNN